MVQQKTLEHYLQQLRLIEEHREKWAEQNIRRHYKDLLEDLNGFLGNEYAELAENDQLTYEILHKKGQYARFLEEVEQRVNTFTPKAAQEIKDTVKTTYKACYEGLVAGVSKSKNYDDLKINLKGLRSVTPDVMKRAVENPISGLTLNDTLEKNRKEVIYNIKQQIGVGLSQGDRMTTMAKRISDQIDMDYRKATRIVRTETHRVREAGFQDSAERVSQTLKDNNSDYVMTKTWKTMRDLSVRPYRPKGKKGHKTFVMGKGPNHVKMEGITVLADEEFDLSDGNKTKAPGQSGVAGHDINCRCYVSHDLMTKAEFEKLTGRKLKDNLKNVEKLEKQENELLNEKESLEEEKAKYEKRQKNLESYEYKDAYGDKFGVGDYNEKKDDIVKSREIFEDKIFKLDDDKIEAVFKGSSENQVEALDAFFADNMGGFFTRKSYKLDRASLSKFDNIDDLEKHVKTKVAEYKSLLKGRLDEFDQYEAQVKTYAKLKNKIDDINIKLSDLDDELVAVKLKKYDAKGITADDLFDDIKTHEKEIYKLNKELADLKQPIVKSDDKVIKVKDVPKDEIQKVLEQSGDYEDYHIKQFMEWYDDALDMNENLDDYLDYSGITHIKNNLKPKKSKLLSEEDLYDYDLGYGAKGKDYFLDDLVKEDVDEDFKILKAKKANGSQMSKFDEEQFENLTKFFDQLDDVQAATSLQDEQIKIVEKAIKSKKAEVVKLQDDLEDIVGYKVKVLDSQVADLDEQIAKIEKEASKYKVKDLKDIKYTDLTGEDYINNESVKEIVDEAYVKYKSWIDDGSATTYDMKKYEEINQFLDDVANALDADESAPEIYKKYQKQLKTLEKERKEAFTKANNLKQKYLFDGDKFSDERKNAALWFTDKNGSVKAADKAYRDKSGEVWRNASGVQRRTAFEYTQSYSKFNEPLRGIEYGTSKFKGVGNIDFDDIGVSTGYGYKRGEVKKMIDDFTDMIDKSSYDADIWLQRGTDYKGMDKFFNVGVDDFYKLSESEMAAKILGTTPTEYGFMSTGVAKGKGMKLGGQGITLNVYAPKNTKMIYAEPWSAYGHGDGIHWDGKSKQLTFGYEAEMILQRNTQFRVIKVEKGAKGRWFIDMEVIGQSR